MSSKHFVGRDLTEFEDNGLTRPVSRVTLFIDDDNQITAGDDTGYELTADCPHGTQAMADAILAKMKGYQYRMFTADAIRYDPAAELGDGVTVSGVYGVLSRLSDDGSGYPDVTAPGEADLEDEYPTGGGPLTKQMERKFAYTRSLITKSSEEIKLLVENTKEGLESSITQTADAIRQEISDTKSGLESSIEQTTTEIKALIEDTKNGLSAEFALSLEGITARVDGLDGQYSELSQTVDGFTFTGPDGETYIKGSSIQTGSITADQIASGSITADKLNIKGAITFGDLAADAQGKITGAQSAAAAAAGAASDAYDYAGRAWTHADNAWDAADAAAGDASDALTEAELASDAVAAWRYQGTTYIDGAMIQTGTVRASILQGGAITIMNEAGFNVGAFTLGSTTSGTGIDIGASAGLKLLGQGGNVHLEAYAYSGNGASLTVYGGGGSNNRVQVNNGPLVSGDSRTLGTSSRPWGTVYSTSDTIVTSDANRKHDIEDLPAKYTAMFDTLRPVRFKYNDGASDRYHTGFIAQDVEAAMGKCGIQDTEFGGFVRGDDGEGGDVLMLRYGEFVGILWAKVQEMDKRIKGLEGAA